MKVLVVHSHPLDDSFAAAARDRALMGLRSAGHQVRLTDLYAEGFEPALSAWEHEHHLDPPDQKPDLARHFDDLRWCDALVLAARVLRDNGWDEGALDVMFKDNPARLLKLPLRNANAN